jgi:pimeloyl-ACP methyl ester carboxylesterase
VRELVVVAMSLALGATAVPLKPASPITLAALNAFDGAKQTVSLPNGVSLAYIDMGPRDAPVLVLVHGYTDSARDWASLAPGLARNFRLIIVDLRGHGASSKPECCYTRFDFADDIRLLVDKLHIGPVEAVVGHSLGSLVAQTFAELWPAATRRLVLVSSTGTSFGPQTACASGGATPIVQSWLAGLAQLRDPIDPDSAFMREWWQESIAINPEFFSSRQRHDAAAIPAQVWRDIADQALVAGDLRPMLPRIQAPTLLIWGGRDTVMSAAGREALRTGIPRSEVRIFPELGHDLIWQDPGALAAAITEFLKKS